MNSFKWFRISLTLCVAFLLALAPSAATAQKKDKDEKKLTGTPVLWKEPTDIATRDLNTGPGGEGMKPDLSRVVFNGSEQGTQGTGYSVKWNVLDGSGKKWVVKVGNEARPETAAVRLVWAAGYVTEINYLVPCLVIVNAPKPRKNVERCEGKGFANVRFEARPKGYKRLDTWSWKDNPFAGTKELQGLKVLLALMNDWDLKDLNNKIIYVPGGDGGQDELQYVISDLGATFGKTGGFISHSRNEPEKFVKTKFIGGVEGNRVKFAFSGKYAGLLDNVTVEQAKWIGDLLAQLSDQQLGDAFRAANFTPEEVTALVTEVRGRIGELTALPSGSAPVGH
jgi:hypothetical protein